jgi:signal transduction histidine kinase
MQKHRPIPRASDVPSGREPRPRDAAAELAAIERVPFFGDLDANQRRELIACGRRRSLEGDQVVFSQGDEPDGMYVVLAGRVKVFLEDSDGNEFELATYGVGGFFGELALLEGRPRSATAKTLGPCECLVLDRAEFMALLARSGPQVTAGVLATLSRIVRDATERLWTQELARQKRRLEAEVARNRSLAQMVAGVAHELNTPLGIANTAADVIENRCRGEELSERLRADAATRAILDDLVEASGLVRRSVLRAHTLVQTFKQMSVHQLPDRQEPIDVGELVAEVVDLFKLNARRVKVMVRVEDRRTDRQNACTGSPSSLTQVLLNLLSNVERYAYPEGGGGVAEISMATAEVGGSAGVALTVRDFGRGIPPDQQSQVFEPFFTTGRGRGGTGLGLAIVYNLVTSALGGRVWIDSEPGQGTAVTVEMPCTSRGPMA